VILQEADAAVGLGAENVNEMDKLETYSQAEGVVSSLPGLPLKDKNRFHLCIY